MFKKIVLLPFLVMPLVVSAQDYYGTNDFATGGSRVYVGTKDLKATIAGIINIVLGFLGILATLGILYGGFMMMTSGGDADKNSKGKEVAVAGAIGLIIVFTAYAISRFVLKSLENQAI
jgi:hypothetical protein